jgi:EAL domain-containing protein (putative c-di-GMP-specific phosphodiesterase class I)
MSHKLDIEVIAEFVSSKEIYDALTLLGIDAMQGYYLGKPEISIKEIEKRDRA